MSVKVMSAVWECEAYSGTDLLVLLALADFANDEGYLWPSIATVARKTRCSERAVQYSMRRLEEDGTLVIVGHEKGGRGLSRQYQIAIQKGANHDTKGANAAPIENPKRVQDDAERVQKMPKRVQPVAPEPLSEPSIEPSRGSLRTAAPPPATPEADLFRRARAVLGEQGASLVAKARRAGMADAELLSIFGRHDRGEVGDLKTYLGALGRNRAPPRKTPLMAALDELEARVRDDQRGSGEDGSADYLSLPEPRTARP